jgi:DHA1 family tetracycline resistance protein-like MFS transporter
MRKPSVLFIFCTVFIDLIGFGIVIPLLPIYAKIFHATGWELGLIASAFSFMQFIFGPLLGRLSDRIGRRPVLLLSTAGAAISYLIFGYGSGLQGNTALIVIFLSRAFAGLCGANITVAQAYIADITPPADRSRKMGLIGMAFGLGFIFGPALGGFARQYLGMSGPGLVAASLCALNFLLALAILPESWKPSSEHVARRPHLDQWLHTVTRPKVGLLIGVFFLATFCFTCFEVTLGLMMFQKFKIDPESAAGVRMVTNYFIYAGLIGAVVQGGLTGRLVKMMGEPRLVALSMILVALSLGPMPFANTHAELLALLALLSIGSSLTRPPVFGMISNLTAAHEQGVTIGVAQSAGSLARIVGPMFCAILFTWIAPLPYLICATISLLTGVMAWQRLSRDHVPGVALEVPRAEA